MVGEGKYCPHCGTYVHIACKPEERCDVCGQSYHHAQRPKADPVRDALLPRALRPSKDAFPIVAMFLFLVIALLVVLVFVALKSATAK